MGSGTNTGRVLGSVTDGQWTAPLLGDRHEFHSVTNPAPFSGRYTMILPGQPAATNSPGGDGYGSIKIDARGFLKLTAMTADDRALTLSTPVSSDGACPVFASLYKGKGSLLGWLIFTNRNRDDFSGLLNWACPSQPASKLYPLGFTNEVLAVGSSYFAPASKTNRVIALTNGVVVFRGGNLLQNFTNIVAMGADSRVVNLGNNRLTLSITASSGLFKGTVVDPAGGNLAYLTNVDDIQIFGGKVFADNKTVIFDGDGRGKFAALFLKTSDDKIKAVTDFTVSAWDISPDEKFIAYAAPDKIDGRPRIFIRGLDGGEPLRVFDVPVGGDIRWTRDGRGLTYAATIDDAAKLFLQPIDGGTPKLLANFPGERIFSFDWSFDGKRLAVVRGKQLTDAVMIAMDDTKK